MSKFKNLFYRELFFFLAWVLHPQSWGACLKWGLEKILQRLMRYFRSNCYTCNYPFKILHTLKESYYVRPIKYTSSSILNETYNKYADLKFIKLASTVLIIENNKIDWTKHFNDPEDEESLHRWNWAIEKLSVTDEKDKIALSVWVQLQQEEWIDKFQADISGTKFDSKLRWESYTVSERISNSIVFYHLTLGLLPSKKISTAIQEQVVYLIQHLEFYGNNTGNHIINNARAIYLAGVFFGCIEWRELAFLIIEREVASLVTGDGFLREGSSHYQFLFTRWMLEVYYFSSVNKDNKMRDFIYHYLQILLKQCQFFLIYNQDEKSWNIPLFGDVSPDFSPEWLLDLPWSSLATNLVKQTTVGYKSTITGWASLWCNVKMKNMSTSSHKKFYSQNVSLTYPESGWFRVVYNDYTIFYRIDREAAPDYVGHHHNDIYHFCLYKNGVPILVDSGRKNYEQSKGSWGSFGISPKAHNSVIVDGVGSLPENNYRYPRKYANCSNSTTIVELEGSVVVTMKSTCFKRLLSPIELVRKIVVTNESFNIEDTFIGSGKHKISAFFHFSLNLDLIKISDNTWEVDGNSVESKFIISLNDTDSLKTTHYNGDESYLGWVVPEYGVSRHASTLKVDGLIGLPAKVDYRMEFSHNT